MKKSLILIALAMVAALSVVSCKNNNKTKELSQEEIQEQKQALADSVLSAIDNLVAQYQEAKSKSDFPLNLVLSDEEKMVKPDYLLDPSLAPTFVTKNQKIAALAFYLCDNVVRAAYDMPLAESKEAIVKLAAEVNYPADVEEMFADSSTPASEYIKQEYNAYKEKNDLASFWNFQLAFLTECEYIFTKNPELFIEKLTEEQNQAITDSWEYLEEAISILAAYDDEIKYIMELNNSSLGELTAEEIESLYSTKEGTIDTYKKDLLHNIEFRNTLLQ